MLSPILELFFYYSLFFIFLSALLIPAGDLLARVVVKDFEFTERFLVSIGLGVFLFAGLVTTLLGLGLDNQQISISLFVYSLIALLWWVRIGGLRELISAKFRFLFLPITIYYLLIILLSAFPVGDIRDIAPDTIMAFTILPIDNYIPFNVSRYLVERINPNGTDVVPFWKASDRGPLAAIVNAGVYMFFNVVEKRNWLSPTPATFFIYQGVLVFLNLLSALGVGLITFKYSWKKSAILSLLFLFSSYFFLQNTIFVWPKFFMAYFFIAGVYLALKNKKILSGLFLALAMLSHDSAIFAIVTLFAVLFFGIGWDVFSLLNRLKNLFVIGLTFLITLLPWLLIKKLYIPPSPRLQYLHLFCVGERDVSSLDFFGVLKDYLKDKSISDLLYVRWTNLSFPFDFNETYRKVAKADLLTGKLEQLTAANFSQALFGIGVFTFLIVFSFLVFSKSNEIKSKLSIYFLSGFGALLVGVLLFGCENWTSAHLWVYPAFLSSAMLLSVAVVNGGKICKTLFIVQIGYNLLILFYGVYYHSLIRPFLHSGSAYLISQLILFVLLFGLLFVDLFRKESFEIK